MDMTMIMEVLGLLGVKFWMQLVAAMVAAMVYEAVDDMEKAQGNMRDR